MTLIEKFTQISIMIGPNHRTKVIEGEARIMEKIAEEFAIGFADWYDKLVFSPRDSVDYHLYLSHTIVELLEIYKKEKGL